MLKCITICFFVVGSLASEQKVLGSSLTDALLHSLINRTSLSNTTKNDNIGSSFLSEILSIDPKDVSNVINILKNLAKQAATEISNLDTLLQKATQDLAKKKAVYKSVKSKLDQSKVSLIQATQHHKDVVNRVKSEKPVLQKQLKVLNEVLRIISQIDPDSSCPKNTFKYKKYCYATMDYLKCSPRSKFNQCPENCQRNYMAFPNGWELVPDTKDIRLNVVGKNYFGTHCVFLQSGRGYSTLAHRSNGLGSYCDPRGGTWRISGNKYKAGKCSYKILMRTHVILGK